MFKKLLLYSLSIFMICGTAWGMDNSWGTGYTCGTDDFDSIRSVKNKKLNDDIKNLLSIEEIEKRNRKHKEALEEKNTKTLANLKQNLLDCEVSDFETQKKELSDNISQIFIDLDKQITPPNPTSTKMIENLIKIYKKINTIQINKNKEGKIEATEIAKAQDKLHTVFVSSQALLEPIFPKQKQSKQIPPALLNNFKRLNKSDERYNRLKNPNFMQSVVDTCKSTLTSPKIAEGAKEIAIASLKGFAVHEGTTFLDDIWHGKLPYVPVVTSLIKEVSGANNPEKLNNALDLLSCIHDAMDREEGYALSDHLGTIMSKINKLTNSSEIKACKSIAVALQQCKYSNQITQQYVITKYLSLIQQQKCPHYKTYKQQAEKIIKEFKAEQAKKLAEANKQKEQQPQPANLKDAQKTNKK